jgi:hypothetical protein
MCEDPRERLTRAAVFRHQLVAGGQSTPPVRASGSTLPLSDDDDGDEAARTRAEKRDHRAHNGPPITGAKEGPLQA